MSHDCREIVERAKGRRIALPGRFLQPVAVEDGFCMDGLVIVRVRTSDGALREETLTVEELAAASAREATSTVRPVPADEFFLLVESSRIRLAFAYDPYFAVNLTGIDVLPHQLEAVYERMLPQVMLRFLLADDPGAGKTIMAGLLLKELKLRGVIERILVVCPAPLTIQWEDELRTKFDEAFELMTAERIRGTYSGNPWQDYPRCIVSVDLAKREDIRERLLEAPWDLVVVDEAHKCSARTDGDKVSKTQRYQLAERLARKIERVLLLTATPHQGNADQFAHFLRLLDEDQFVDLDRDKQILLDGELWYLRRMKEDLRDFEGRPLFTKRHAFLQEFALSDPEYELYEAVTDYINEYLPRMSGRRRTSVALARIVLQRRLASSLGAITSSLERRHRRLQEMLRDVESLPSSERAARLAKYRLIDVDPEQELDDETEEEQDEIAGSTLVAETLERLADEVAVLEGLVKLAKETQALGQEAKLEALRDCLERSELADLKDARGKLLIFTEHRDTLDYLLRHLREWGFTTTQIHGGMSPQERRDRQRDFASEGTQICVATEAAGEGINLQFCHLMINYDMPWNPIRLEQRMGRIHRIGQPHDVYVFNFVARNTVEGKVLATLLRKLEEIKGTLGGDRVYDVVGELLKLNDVNLEELIREAAYNPRNIEEYLDDIRRIDPERLKRYEEAVGVALARSHVDLTRIRGEDWRSQERRLMPEYVESFFHLAAAKVGLSVERRADAFFRVEHVPGLLRSDELRSVARLGRPAHRYLKFTFLKELARQGQHQDSDLVSPGHPLFAALDEVLNQRIARCREAGARYLDPFSPRPYRLHFYETEVRSGTIDGRTEPAEGALVAVLEDEAGKLHLAAPDILHDLTPSEPGGQVEADPERQEEIRRFVMARVQHGMRQRISGERRREVEIRRKYLSDSFAISVRKARSRWLELADRATENPDYALVRDNARRELEELEKRRDDRLASLASLELVVNGPVRYLGTALVEPTLVVGKPDMRRDDEVEAAAMAHVLDYERSRGWEAEDVSELRDGSGFDIRSVGPPDEDDRRPVRRIEVKGRAAENLGVELTPNEWVQAGRHGDTYWLYVVWNATTAPRLIRIQNPAVRLRGRVEELVEVRGYRVPPEAIVAGAAT